LADRLTALGATVHLTRETDVDVSLQERVNFSKEHRPDLFISLHADSVDPTTNAANISGFTVWYSNFNSIDLSETMLDVLYYINPNTNRDRHIRHANFFVTRPQWAPSILLEASFMVNIDDFAWLIDPVQQARLADATADAILDYFR
jgi:N-acetylmuramoyl-L-alanine amidase